MAEAVCRVEKIPVETFYTANDKARAICDRCPVAWQCRDYAYRTEEKHGIWGGVNFAEWAHPQNLQNFNGINDPRIREVYRRVWARNAPVGHRTNDARRALRRLSDPELELLAALEDFI
jgi:hypothetical protein